MEMIFATMFAASAVLAEVKDLSLSPGLLLFSRSHGVVFKHEPFCAWSAVNSPCKTRVWPVGVTVVITVPFSCFYTATAVGTCTVLSLIPLVSGLWLFTRNFLRRCNVDVGAGEKVVSSLAASFLAEGITHREDVGALVPRGALCMVLGILVFREGAERGRIHRWVVFCGRAGVYRARPQSAKKIQV